MPKAAATTATGQTAERPDFLVIQWQATVCQCYSQATQSQQYFPVVAQRPFPEPTEATNAQNQYLIHSVQ